jgi:hypothetical protein
VFTDPLSVTYNSVVKTLPRVSGNYYLNPKRVLATSKYATSDGEFSVFIRQSLLEDRCFLADISLGRVTPDDIDPETSPNGIFPNRVGLQFVTNEAHFASSVDIPLLRSALLTLVDSSFQTRLIGGES